MIRSICGPVTGAVIIPTILVFLSIAPLSEGRESKRSKMSPPPVSGPVSDNTILAEVNGEKILVSQLRAWMGKTDLRHTRAFAGEKEARKIAFRELINERLAAQYMRREGNTKSDEFQGRIKALRAISLGNRFLSEYKKGYVPSGEEVRPLLPSSFIDLDLRIFFGTTFEETTEVRESVLGGDDMDRLVRERSVGPSAENGGMVRSYRSKTYIPEHIEKGAFSSGKGWVSPVFDTPLGYAFVRVEEASNRPMEDIASATESVIHWSREAAGIRKIEETILQAGISMDEEKVRELDVLSASKWMPRFGEVIAHVGKEAITVQDLYWFIVEGKGKDFPDPGSGKVLELLNSYTSYIAVAKEAVAQGIGQDPSFEEWIEAKSDRILLQMYIDEVNRSVRVSDQEAREHFRKNRDMWKRPPGREIREVQAPDQQMALALLDQLREHPEQIDRFAAGSPGKGKGQKGVILYRGKLNAEDEKRVFEAPVGKLVGPFPRGNVWSMIIVDREVPAVDDPVFEVHAAEARFEVRKEKLNRTLQEKMDSLYRKASILTYNEVLNSVGW